MEIYSKAMFGNNWVSLDTLSPLQRRNFKFINSFAESYSSGRMYELLHQYNLRRRFALYKYESYKQFTKEELFKACEELARVDLPIDFKKLNLLESLNIKYRKQKVIRPTIARRLGDDEQMTILFWRVILHTGLAEEYLQMQIDFKNIFPRSYDVKNFKDFDKVIELLGRFRWLRFLKEIVDNEEYDLPAVIKKEKRTLSDIALQFVWEGNIINRQNKDVVASKLTSEGIISLKNGNKLYYRFCFYDQKFNRTGDQAGDTKNKNHLKVMIRASENLKEKRHKESAENDILAFKANAEKISGTIL